MASTNSCAHRDSALVAIPPMLTGVRFWSATGLSIANAAYHCQPTTTSATRRVYACAYRYLVFGTEFSPPRRMLLNALIHVASVRMLLWLSCWCRDAVMEVMEQTTTAKGVSAGMSHAKAESKVID